MNIVPLSDGPFPTCNKVERDAVMGLHAGTMDYSCAKEWPTKPRIKMKTYQEFLTESTSISMAAFKKEVKKLSKDGTVEVVKSNKDVSLSNGSQKSVLFTHEDPEFLDAKEKQFKVWLKKV